MFGEGIHGFWLRMKALVRRREFDRDLDKVAPLVALR